MNVSPRIAYAAVRNAYGMSDLLEPQLDRHINLRIPDWSYSKVPKLSSALKQSIDFLVSRDTPLRLFYNFTVSKRAAPLVFTPSRNVPNQVVWLVFVIVQTKTEALNLWEAMNSCGFETGYGPSSIVHKDWIQLVTDEAEFLQPWDEFLDINIHHQYVTLYFVVLRWSSSRFTNSHAILVRENDWCDKSHPLRQIYDFLGILKEPLGMQRIGVQIRNIKTDLMGRRIVIQPNIKTSGSWESRWRDLFIPFSFRHAYQNWECTYVVMFDSFMRLNNCTFDLALALKTGYPSDFPSANLLITAGSFAVLLTPLDQTLMPPLSLYGFTYDQIFYSTKPAIPDPTKLPSLKAPCSDPTAAVILLSLSFCMTLTMLLLRGNLGKLIRTMLFTLTKFIGKDSVVGSDSRRFWLLYTSWLFLRGFITMTYTNKGENLPCSATPSQG